MLNLINILLLVVLSFGANKTTNNIEKLLNNRLDGYKRFEYQIVSPKHLELSKIIIDNSREIKIEKDHAYLPVLFKTKGKLSKKGIVTLKLNLYKDVLIAINDIRRREKLSQADYKIEEREISNLRGKPINLNKNIPELRVKRKIKHGMIILENMIEKIPDIKRGEIVNAMFRKGIVNISFEATARTEGNIGEVIKIKRNDNKIFKAEIVSSKQVRIIE